MADTTTKTPKALDVSKYVKTEAIPEVAALKQKVREVAAKYQRQNRWCDEVTRALKEAGIEPEETVKVNVVSTLLGDVTLDVFPSILHGKTLPEQMKAIAETIGDISISASQQQGGRSRSLSKTVKTPVETITSIALWTPPKSNAKKTGYVWVLGEGNRVSHLTRQGEDVYYPTAVCGQDLWLLDGNATKHATNRKTNAATKCKSCVKHDK